MAGAIVIHRKVRDHSRIVIFVTLVALSGCARTTINTNKAADYTAEPKKMYLLESFAGGLGPSTDIFRAKLSESLAKCQVAIREFRRDAKRTLDLNATNGWQTIGDAAAVQNFQADTVLAVSETGYRRKEISGDTVSADYGLELFDVKGKRTVWKAEVTLSVASGFSYARAGNRDPGMILALDIVKRMGQDGILRSCPADPT